jgi:hypothetical protein
MTDPFAHMALALAGTAPPVIASPAEATAARLSRAAEVLRSAGEPELIELAEGIEQWLACGGNLAELLGVRPRRGGRNDLPANAAAEHTKRVALRNIVQTFGLVDVSPSMAAKWLALMLSRPVIGARLAGQFSPGVELPKSERQLRRLMKGMDTKS